MGNPLDDEIILYTKIEDYEARLAFVGPMEVEIANLDKIVGKYELGKQESLWAHCGLNGCDRPHRFGYIIRMKDGCETNCGHDCGHREFGVNFEEVEAQYKRGEEVQARRRAAEDVLVQARPWLDELIRLLPAIRAAEGLMNDFSNDFRWRISFWGQLHKIAKAGGGVNLTVRDEDGKLVTEPIGRIHGCRVLIQKPSWNSDYIASQMVPWLESLSAANAIEIDEYTFRKSDGVQSVLREAPQFIEDVTLFLNRNNFQLFDKMCMRGICKPGSSGWGDAIRKWMGESQRAA